MNEKEYKWLKIPGSIAGSDAYLPVNEVRTIRVDDKTYCLGRLHDGYYALKNTCPHAGGSLGDGWCDSKGNVICPLHRAKFDLRTGRNTTGEGYYVSHFPVKEEAGELYIGMEVKKSFWGELFG